MAAISVAIFHTHSNFWPQQAASGTLAVDIFFVLSGFVLAGAYEGRLASERLSIVGFIQKRVLRFYPLYFLGLMLGILQVLAQTISHSPNTLPFSSIFVATGAALIFIPAFGSGVNAVAPLNSPAWSLICELWVNIGWASVSRRSSVFVYAVIAVLSACVFVYLSLIANSTNLGPSLSDLPGAIARTVFSFFTGLLIYNVRKRSGRQRSLSAWAILFFTAIVLFYRPTSILVFYYEIAVIMIVSPLIVTFGSMVEPSARISKIFSFMADISFPLYIIHQPVISAFIFFEKRFGINSFLSGIAFLLATIALSWFAHKADVRLRERISKRVSVRSPN